MSRGKPNQKYTAGFMKQFIKTMQEEHLGYRETTVTLFSAHTSFLSTGPVLDTTN